MNLGRSPDITFHIIIRPSSQQCDPERRNRLNTHMCTLQVVAVEMMLSELLLLGSDARSLMRYHYQKHGKECRRHYTEIVQAILIIILQPQSGSSTLHRHALSTRKRNLLRGGPSGKFTQCSSLKRSSESALILSVCPHSYRCCRWPS
eukprot:1624568-Pleurochrysis_carterae.AAC.1